MPLEIFVIRAGGPDDSKNKWRHRGLGDHGYGASKQMRKKLGEPAFDLVLCSNVFRTCHTASLVADRPYEPKDNECPTVVDELFPTEGSENENVFVRLFEDLVDQTHQTLAKYYSSPSPGGELLRVTAHVAAEAVRNKILVSLGAEKLPNAKVLVVANDGMTAAFVEQFLSIHHYTKQADLDMVRTTMLGDAEGFRIKIEFAIEGIGLVSEVKELELLQLQV